MALNLATLNVQGLRDSSKCARFLAELKNLHVMSLQFFCATDCRVLENDFAVFLAYGSHNAVNVVFTGGDDQLVVADVAFKSFEFRLIVVYASNIAVERVSLFRRLAPFLDDSKRLVLMGDWNTILYPNIDKVGWGASRFGRCESSLVDLMARHDLVNRFRLDHTGREIWTWLDS